MLLAVLDGMRPDYFDRYADVLPTLSRLRREAAQFTNARIDYLPTNTGVGHATIATGTDPRFHGITGNNLYDRVARDRFDSLKGWSPRDLMASTLSDVWAAETDGTAVIIAQGSSVPAATALAGHGACLINGRTLLMAGYDSTSGRWGTNASCFSLPPYLADADARLLWGADGQWMGHKIDSPAGVRRSGLFPAFEADALTAMIDRAPIGADAVTDLVLANLKGADFVGHKHGPDSPELRATLAEVDRGFTRIYDSVSRKAGGNVVLAVVADHGMPAEPHAGARVISEDVTAALHERFDPQDKKLILYYEPENGQLMVDEARLAARGLTMTALARFLEAQPYLFAAFTEDEVRAARVK
jgi:predicted AlkP superfamily pyrophosphatase or phosphodiesterase